MSEGSKKRRRLSFPREVLLVEIERRCADARCNAKTRVGLTKEEARSYNGFVCERCERHWDDALTERDVPEWWEELAVTGLEGVRTRPTADAPGAVVTRMSDEWRRISRLYGDAAGEEDGG